MINFHPNFASTLKAEACKIVGIIFTDRDYLSIPSDYGMVPQTTLAIKGVAAISCRISRTFCSGLFRCYFKAVSKLLRKSFDKLALLLCGKAMRYWVHYHNYEKLGKLPDGSCGISTDQEAVPNTVGDTIF